MDAAGLLRVESYLEPVSPSSLDDLDEVRLHRLEQAVDVLVVVAGLPLEPQFFAGAAQAGVQIVGGSTRRELVANRHPYRHECGVVRLP